MPTRNPLSVDPAHEHRVRERAYHLWEADGRPHGRDVEYWERARDLIGGEKSAGNGLLPNHSAKSGSPRKAPVEKASIKANLGGSPNGLADQSAVKASPAPKRKTGARPKKPA
jgi:hypothetical protein